MGNELDCPRKRKGGDPGSAGVLEHPGALVHRCARREYIIDEQNVPVLQFTRPPERKSARDVFYPFRSCQFYLRPRWPHSFEIIERERQGKGPAQLMGKNKGLIESPLPEPRNMERHRYDTVDVRNRSDVYRHPCGQRFAQRSAGPVLELVDRLAERPLKIADRQSLIEDRRRLPACQAAMVGAVRQCFGRVKRFSTPGAHGSIYRRKIRPAGCAEIRDRGTAD